MKTFLKITTIFLIAGMLFNSCEENWLDINQDPNNPSDAPAELIFPSGVAQLASVVGGRYCLVGGIYSQWWTQANSANQYKRFSAFNISPTDLENEFEDIYAGALKDFQVVRNKAKQNDNWSYYLMSTVMEAYTYQILVDIYDKVPFTEALKGAENPNPVYDDGQLIYDSLIARIDRALAKPLYASSSVNPKEKDLVFGGDLAKWVQFANTLKLKIYLRQRYARPEVAENGIDALYANGANFLTVSATMDVFEDAANKSNPFYEMDKRQLNTPNNLRASKTLYDFLDANTDPRRLELYEEAENGGYMPMKQGNHNAPSTGPGSVDPKDISVIHLEATDPVYFISAAETYFMKAEVALEYGHGDAKTNYDHGVNAAFAQFGIDGSSFVAAGGPYEFPSGGSAEDKLEAIMTQKWAGFARFQGIEAWIEWKRTGYPEVNAGGYEAANYELGQFVSPVSNNLGENKFPLRMLFPQSERSNNTNTPDQVSIDQPVWWDQD